MLVSGGGTLAFLSVVYPAAPVVVATYTHVALHQNTPALLINLGAQGLVDGPVHRVIFNPFAQARVGG